MLPAEPSVRPWWHNISQFSHGFTTCFIRGSNRLAGMDGTLGVAPHAYDAKFASWLVSQYFAATILRRLRGGPWKRRAVRARKHRVRANVRICAWCWSLDSLDHFNMIQYGYLLLLKLDFHFLSMNSPLLLLNTTVDCHTQTIFRMYYVFIYKNCYRDTIYFIFSLPRLETA